MTYVDIGPRSANAAPDQTGLNQGNLTTAFTSAILDINIANAEIYHMVIANVPIGASAQIVKNNKFWGFTFPNQGSEWDPKQPLLIRPTDEVDFLWSVATGNPQVTIWIRYDPIAQPGAVQTV